MRVNFSNFERFVLRIIKVEIKTKRIDKTQ